MTQITQIFTDFCCVPTARQNYICVNSNNLTSLRDYICITY